MCVSRLAGRFRKLAGKVKFTAEFYPPDSRRRDLDNVLKCTLDALVHAGLMEDDSQIKHLDVRMGEPVGAGRPVGECGNSGNSTQPHVHLQATDSIDWSSARG